MHLHPPTQHTHTQHQYTQVEPKAARNLFKMTDHTKVVYAQVDKKKLKLVDINETPPRESSIGCLLQHSVWTNAVFLFFTVHLSLWFLCNPYNLAGCIQELNCIDM